MIRVLLALSLGFWPIFPWYLARVRDGSDDPLGLLALLLAVLALIRERRRISLSALGCAMGLCCLLLALFCGHLLSPMVLAVLAVVAGSAALGLPRRQPGIFLLLLLSLPIIASLQFYAGYPLRVVAAELSVYCLRAGGCEVTREGTTLLWLGNEIGVDPPCSGVKMLWTCVLVAAALAAHSRMTWGKLLLVLLPATVLLAVLGNALRATLLFPLESGMMPALAGYHAGMGLVATAATLYAVLRLHDVLLLPSRVALPPLPDSAPLLAHRLSTGMLGVALVLCFQPRSHLPTRAVQLAPWPTEFYGFKLEALPLTTREESFAECFPGQLARFRCGPGELILRQVQQPTRLLHSSRDCLRAAGYEIHPLPHCVDAQGLRWSVCLAEKPEQTLRVLERISEVDATQSWTDVSAWFWSALLRPTGGPWQAATYLVPLAQF